jgi:hypothetical protein
MGLLVIFGPAALGAGRAAPDGSVRPDTAGGFVLVVVLCLLAAGLPLLVWPRRYALAGIVVGAAAGGVLTLMAVSVAGSASSTAAVGLAAFGVPVTVVVWGAFVVARLSGGGTAVV